MKAKTKRELQCMNYGFKKAVEQRDKDILEIIDKMECFDYEFNLISRDSLKQQLNQPKEDAER